MTLVELKGCCYFSYMWFSFFPPFYVYFPSSCCWWNRQQGSSWATHAFVYLYLSPPLHWRSMSSFPAKKEFRFAPKLTFLAYAAGQTDYWATGGGPVGLKEPRLTQKGGGFSVPAKTDVWRVRSLQAWVDVDLVRGGAAYERTNTLKLLFVFFIVETVRSHTQMEPLDGA